MAKASLKAGLLTRSQYKTGDQQNQPQWLKQMDLLIDEIGRLKGSAMKVGQALSIYGEHLLPKEINDRLKRLQQDSPPLAWPAIEAVMLQELGQDRLNELEVEHEPTAAASIGQVHRAIEKSSGQVMAIKVQYPGVDSAIDSDLKLLKFIFTMTEIVPRGPRMDMIFAEIREMFAQEIDYRFELNFGHKFHELLQSDSRYLVPRGDSRYSTQKILSTPFVVGHRIDSPEVQGLSLERRNRLGQAYFELYLRELFEFKLMQTDPHLGNYLVQIDSEGQNDKLVLFDFGAVRTIPNEFLKHYVKLIEGGLNRNERQIEVGGRGLKLLLPEDPIELVRDYVDLSLSLMEPFDGVYEWGSTDLPQRVAAKVTNVAFNYKLRAPPRELVFLDRKLGGVFIFLSVLKCQLDARPWLELAFKNFQASQDLE